MSSTWQTAVLGLALIVAANCILWLISLRLRDSSIVDPFWGMGFTLLAWTAYLRQPPGATRSLMICGLVTVWGLRLSLYLLWRNSGHAEDSRYASMRQHHGARYWWVSLFTVFLLQAVILWIVALPILMTSVDASRPIGSAWEVCGIALWSIGLFFESVGDWQLAHFKSNPTNQGKVLNRGLWRYTRHPNYFGDFCVWWGIYLISASSGPWWTIISPLTMSVLLMWVSGVTLLESKIEERRPGYADYRRMTNAFFPWFPRSSN